MVSLFPTSWNGRNSGVSRKRPLRNELAERKLPSFLPPRPRVASSPTAPKEPYCAAKLPNGFWPSPERVTALTTRLVLSPNSAPGAPVISSIDWMALSGICVENCLLCWSEIGCPSIEKLVCA